MKIFSSIGMSFAIAKLKAKIALAVLVIIGFSMAGCIINVPDDKPNTSLNGDWRGLNGEVVRISGSTGVFQDLSDTTSGLWGSAASLGIIEKGTLMRDHLLGQDSEDVCQRSGRKPVPDTIHAL
jgi:hypothetical protein